MAVASLYTLPIELVYHIFNNLDSQTILCSFRNVCKRFYIIVNTYNRYELDLSSILKSDFHRVCRIIRPENIISLTLSDNDMTPGQICLFMSFFNINQLIHLRSLTLIHIERSELNVLMEQININSLNSLSIDIRKNHIKSEDPSIISLLSNIVMTNLRKLDISMRSHEINHIVWPMNCTLQHLTLGYSVTFKQICTILCQLSHLRTLILKNCIISDTDEMIMTSSNNEKNTNLNSLTFKNSRLQMNELELLLSLTSSLVYLQLTGDVSSSDAILDGSRWEEFIQTKLSLLEKFEFFFRAKLEINHNPPDIQSWVIPFRTIFWLEHKSWFVTCNYIIKTTTLRLYSIPTCDPYITYESEFDNISCTTDTIFNNDTLTFNNVREVQLDLTQIMDTVKVQKIAPRTTHLFRRLTELTLTIKEEWPTGSIDFLSTLIDLSHLTTLELYANSYHSTVLNTINNIGCLLEQTYNVHSLILSNSLCHGTLNGIVENFCSIIPHHIKHLQLCDMNVDDVKIFLKRLKHLSSVTFIFLFDMPFSHTEITEWLEQRVDFTYLVDNYSLSLWLGVKKQLLTTTASN